MKKEMVKKSLYTVFFTLAVTAVFMSALSLAYAGTKERILLNEGLFLMRGVMDAADMEVPDDPVKAAALYEKSVVEKKLPAGKGHYYVVGEGPVKAYVFDASGAGLWGRITALIGFDAELRKITGFEILDQNETPGLGGRISEDWFRHQFRGKTGPFAKLVSEKEDSGPISFSAVTGATATSNAVKELLNDAIRSDVDAVRALTGEGL